MFVKAFQQQRYGQDTLFLHRTLETCFFCFFLFVGFVPPVQWSVKQAIGWNTVWCIHQFTPANSNKKEDGNEHYLVNSSKSSTPMLP